MAKNPLFRNEYYFFSDMYDDSLITQFYNKISNESYDKSILYQQNMLGRKHHRFDDSLAFKSTIGEFKIDDQYNLKVGIPEGSRTITFDTLILPVHDKYKYISTYGVEYKKIPLIDFYKRGDIFDKSIALHIGEYRVIAAYLIENVDKTVTLAIPNSEDGILSSRFYRLLQNYDSDEPVMIFFNEISKVYYADTATRYLKSSQDSTASGFYELIIRKSYELNDINKFTTSDNSWDCLITDSNSVYGKNVLTASSCNFKEFKVIDDEEYAVFYVSRDFFDYIQRRSANVKIYFIHRPHRKQPIWYTTRDSLPIFNLDYDENPSANINIEIYEEDISTMRKLRRVYDPSLEQSYFPNIFDFSKLEKYIKLGLLIEVIEYPSSMTNQKMTNSISPLIDTLGPELYTEYVVNGYDKSLNGISLGLKEYSPTSYSVSMNDYITSEYYGDYRGYILDKISKTIESDPYLFASYYKWMNAINSKVYTSSGTPKKLQFGTTKSGEFSGDKNRIVNDTSGMSIIPEDIQYFSEPHSYITYYSSGNKCPANVYVNGKYVRPTCIRHYKGLNYLFFPVKLIEDEMSIYHADSEICAASPISIDFYPTAYMSDIEAPIDHISINSLEDSFTIFDNIKNPKFALNELVVYDDTGKYLGLITDVFNIKLDVMEYIVKNPGEENKILISRESDPKQLLTFLNEIYCTADGVSILIGGNKISLSWNDFVETLISEGVINESGKKYFLNKKLNFKDITLTPKDENMIGLSVSIYSRAFKKEFIINSNEGIYNESAGVTKYIIRNASIDPDPNRYLVFENGILDIMAEVIPENHYNDSLSIKLSGDRTTNNSQIIVVHLPIEYTIEKFTISNNAYYMQDRSIGDLNIKDPTELWNCQEGLRLQSYEGNLNTLYPFEDCKNIKYTESGLRLPPSTNPNHINTNSIYAQYYYLSTSRILELIYGISPYDSGIVYRVSGDMPITDIYKQNLYSTTYDNSRQANPLDILLYHRQPKFTNSVVGTERREWSSVCYGDGKFVAVAYEPNIFAHSIDCNSWTEVNIGGSYRGFRDICYGNKMFVAVSYKYGSIFYSPDGTNWDICENVGGVGIYWYSVCYGNDKFVAVAYNSNVFAYSTDGKEWIKGTISNTKRDWRSICYGNDKFVAVASNSNIFAYSYDGINWEEETISDTERDWWSICYGNDKFVAVSLDSTIFAYSYNGITWTEGTMSDTNRNWRSICYGNGMFVAVADNSNIFAYSYNGIDWTEGTISDTERDWWSICYGNGMFVAVADDSNIFACGK